jgi:hypothetical protein
VETKPISLTCCIAKRVAHPKNTPKNLYFTSNYLTNYGIINYLAFCLSCIAFALGVVRLQQNNLFHLIFAPKFIILTTTCLIAVKALKKL